jgi:hypothetical protein
MPDRRMNANSFAPASRKIRLSSTLSRTRLVTTMSLRSKTLSMSSLIACMMFWTMVGACFCTRPITILRTASGIDSHSPGWNCVATCRVISSMLSSSGFSISLATRSASSRLKISSGLMSLAVIVSQAMLAIRAARRGTMPCQPRYGGLPRNSIGRNIISIATTLVTYPITAARIGIDR